MIPLFSNSEISLIPNLLWIIAIVIFVLTTVGFFKDIWFMSIGYGLAIMGAGIVTLIYAMKNGANIWTYLMCLLEIFYGLRLGLFLVFREFKNVSYQKSIIDEKDVDSPKVIIYIILWLYLSFMYLLQCSPLIYRLANGYGKNNSTNLIVGVIIMAVGIIFEVIADKQKSDYKLSNPDKFCDIGLFKYSRCPSYFSEILIWTGEVIACADSIVVWQWILVLLGYYFAVRGMIDSAKGLEKRQEEKYGNDEEYQKYADSTPILFPFIPFYHFEKIDRRKNKAK